MFRKIYTFGCSFSAPYWLEEEKTYTSLLAKNYNCEESNNSKPADCNDAIFLKFTDHLPDFKENDLIIYQFTSYNREGFYINNHKKYFSTAGLSPDPEHNRKLLDEFGGGRAKYKITDDEIMTLLDYTSIWSIYSLRNKFLRVYNILQYLKEEKNIDYQVLFLDNLFSSIVSSYNLLKLPTRSNELNVGIKEWVTANKLRLIDMPTVYHKQRDEHISIEEAGIYKQDKHPNEKAHELIAKAIMNKLTEKASLI